MKEITLPAVNENIGKVTDFVDSELETHGFPAKEKMQLAIAIDEIFSNIARYAYRPEEGEVTVKVEIEKEPLSATITFTDGGVPYNPLSSADPDTSLSAEERQIGGLGIFMVKRIMDDVEYHYENNKNILTIRKKIGS